MAVPGLFWSVTSFAAAPTYTLTDLGISPGYTESNAVAINNAGQVAGNLIDNGGVEHAFVYSNGAMTVLPVVAGYDHATAVSMNNAGQIVGTIDDGNGGFNAFSYSNGTMIALVHGAAPPGPNQSFANDVNDSGLVVGGGLALFPNNTHEDAWIFPDTDLGIVSGYSSSEALAVNKSGKVVLSEQNGFAGAELFLYSGGTFQDLGIGVAGSGAGGTRPVTINDSGQIIGSFPYTGGDTGHPFLYANGNVTDLGPAVGNGSTLYDINNSGQIVGTLGSAGFVYIKGTNYLLSNLSINGATGWVFYDARGINDSGQIVGRGYNNNSTDRRTRAFLLTPPGGSGAPATLGNISTRLRVLAGNNVLIGGVIISGTDPKSVLFRALGPTLGAPPFNVPGAMADPTLELHGTDAKGNDIVLATNDNWKDSQQTAITGTGKAPPNNLESAILKTLLPGNYTVIVRGKNDTTGVALVEAYDVSPTTNSQLANISSRGFVNTGDNAMIGGFIVEATSRFLVRGLGPTLGAPPFDIAGVLADPTLELHNGSGDIIATNDNWKTRDSDGTSQEAAITATGKPPPNDAEAAILMTLAPGNYTAILRGKNSTTGVALVEVYNVP